MATATARGRREEHSLRLLHLNSDDDSFCSDLTTVKASNFSPAVRARRKQQQTLNEVKTAIFNTFGETNEDERSIIANYVDQYAGRGISKDKAVSYLGTWFSSISPGVDPPVSEWEHQLIRVSFPHSNTTIPGGTPDANTLPMALDIPENPPDAETNTSSLTLPSNQSWGENLSIRQTLDHHPILPTPYVTEGSDSVAAPRPHPESGGIGVGGPGNSESHSATSDTVREAGISISQSMQYSSSSGGERGGLATVNEDQTVISETMASLYGTQYVNSTRDDFGDTSVSQSMQYSASSGGEGGGLDTVNENETVSSEMIESLYGTQYANSTQDDSGEISLPQSMQYSASSGGEGGGLATVNEDETVNSDLMASLYGTQYATMDGSGESKNESDGVDDRKANPAMIEPMSDGTLNSQIDHNSSSPILHDAGVDAADDEGSLASGDDARVDAEDSNQPSDQCGAPAPAGENLRDGAEVSNQRPGGTRDSAEDSNQSSGCCVLL